MSDSLSVQLELDDGRFTSGIIRAGQSLSQFEAQVGKNIANIRAMDGHTKDFLSTLRDVSIVTSVAAMGIHALHTVTGSWVGEIIKVNAEFERMNTLMRTLSTSGDPMKDSLKSVTAIREMAKNAPFSLNALHDSFTRLNAAGLKPAEGMMNNLVDAVAAFGGGDDVIKRASLAFQEMAGKGVVQMKELRNQLGMAIPNAMKLLARTTGESYQEMMSDVHTGTVDAKTAIMALQLEFGRAFGGAALAQVQTFNGQISHMKVMLQDIAIKNVGHATLDDATPDANGFFEKTKKQVADLNLFIEGPAGKNIGESLGRGLISGIEGFRSFIDMIWKFRVELRSLAGDVTTAFVILAGGKFVQTAFSFVEGLTLKWEIYGRSIDRVKASYIAMTEVQAAQRMIGVGDAATRTLVGVSESSYALATSAPWSPNKTPKENSAAYKALAPSMGAVAFAGVGALAGGIATILPMLPLLALGLGAAAEYFDLFGHKAKDAYADLKQFGAQTEAEAHKADKFIEELREKARRSQSFLDYDKANYIFPDREFQLVGDETLARKDKHAADEAEIIQQKALIDGRQNEAKQLAAAYSDSTNTKMRDRIRLYNQVSNASQDAYEITTKQLAAEGKSELGVKLAHQMEVREVQLQLYRDEIKIQEELFASGEKLGAQQGATPIDIEAAAQTKENAQKALTELKAQMKQTEALPLGLVLGKKPQDDAKILEKAHQAYEKLQGDIEAYGAGIRGADVESERLYQVWERIKGGDLTAANGIAKMIEQIREAKAEADDLDKILRGGAALDHALLEAGIKAKTHLMDIQTEGMSGTDKIGVQAAAGMFSGYGGDSPDQKRLQAMRLWVEEQGKSHVALINIAKAAGEAAVAIAEMIGPTMLAKVKDFTTTGLGSMYDWLQKIAGTKIDITPTINTPDGATGAGGAAIGATGAGGAAIGAGDYFSKIKNAEDAGGAMIKNPRSTAFGPVQFTKGTWETLVNSPEGKAAGLTLAGIADVDQQEKALRIFTRKNAQALSGAGITPSEANLRMAHFLGAGGATSFMNGMVSNPGASAAGLLPDAAKSNPEVFYKDGGIARSLAEVYEKQTKGFSQNRPDLSEDRPDYFSQSHNVGLPGMPKKPWENEQFLPDAKKKKLNEDRYAEEADAIATAKKAHDDDLEKAKALAEQYKLQLADDGTRYAKFRADVKSMAPESRGSKQNNHDPDSAFWKSSGDAERAADASKKTLDEHTKLKTSSESADKAIREQGERAKEKSANEWERVQKQPSLTPEAENAQEQANKHLADFAKIHNKNSQEYRDEASAAKKWVDDVSSYESAKALEAINKKTEIKKRGLMEQDAAQEDALKKEYSQYQRMLDNFKGTEEQKAVLTKALAESMAADRAAALAKTPIGKQMQDWGQTTKNLESGVSSWMTSSMDALSTLAITGKANWAQLSQSILKDLMQITMKSAVSGLFNSSGAGGLLGGAGGEGGGGLMNMFGGLGKMFGVAHTGGVLGSSMLSTRSGSMLDFIGAPRFHTGGIIGPNEVPIIAKKGEGVFTPEQMAAMGNRASGSRSGDVAIHNNLTVNAAGGTDAQNEDLAQRMQSKMEDVTRTLIVSEILKQMRPGNILNH